MKKIGIVFMLFGFFFPIILALFTNFPLPYKGTHEGFIRTIQSGEIIISHEDNAGNYVYIPYSYALAFSIIVFAVGIGFLLLSEQNKKGGGSFR